MKRIILFMSFLCVFQTNGQRPKRCPLTWSLSGLLFPWIIQGYIFQPPTGSPTQAVPTNLEALNSAKDENSAFIAPDKSYIIFRSQQVGGYGWDDLYISFPKKNGSWTNPINLGPVIHTIDAEFSPQGIPDGRFLGYSKWDKNNKWSDIYWVRIDKIIKKLKKEAYKKEGD